MNNLQWLKRNIIKETDECIVWPFAKTSRGYGQVWCFGKQRSTHRVAFHLATGFDLDSVLDVLHKCDNEPCFNPKHLFSGTQKDNVRDSSIKERNGKGTKCKRGHLLSGDNLYTYPSGKRACRKCKDYGSYASRERSKLLAKAQR